MRRGIERGRPPAVDLVAEAALCRLLVAAAEGELLQSAHDLSEGGLAVALAECAVLSGIGLTVDLEVAGLRPEQLLFGESAGRVVVSAARADVAALLELGREHSVPVREIGRTGGERIALGLGVDVALQEAHDLWARALPEALR